MHDYSGYEIINIQPFPRVEGDQVYVRPGLKFVAKCPARVERMAIIERKKLVAFTLRGAFWVREGKKPRRIQAEFPVYKITFLPSITYTSLDLLDQLRAVPIPT